MTKKPLNLTEKGRKTNKIHINIYFMRHLFGSFKNNCYLCKQKETNITPKSRKGKSIMKTKEEVIEIIKKDMSGCYTCSYSCDEQGFNGWFSAQYVDDLFKEENQVNDYNVWCLLDEGWELCEFEPVTNEDIDIHEWAQEFDDDTIEHLRKDIDAGGFYIATFCNDTWGTQKILVW